MECESCGGVNCQRTARTTTKGAMSMSEQKDTNKASGAATELNEGLECCPFCGKAVDLEDPDTLYPSGTGWLYNESLGCRTYHSYREVPKEQWCWTMHCPVTSGGCGAEMPGDSKAEVIAAWNKRHNAR